MIDAPAAPWVLELCHAHGCTCTELEVTWWGSGPDDGEPLDVAWPDDWWHAPDCPFAQELELTLRAAGVDPGDVCAAFLVLHVLDVDTVERIEARRADFRRSAGMAPELLAANLALLDWREHRLRAAADLIVDHHDERTRNDDDEQWG